jgi:hypothetical protein
MDDFTLVMRVIGVMAIVYVLVFACWGVLCYCIARQAAAKLQVEANADNITRRPPQRV